MMKISERGLAIIKKYEGCRLKAYKCPAGVWTIGYGHTAGVKEGQTITQAQADVYLKQDAAWAERAVNNLGKDFNQNQFDALVSFTFNCGAGNLKKLCNGRDLENMGKKMVLYNKAGGKVLEGLTKRRFEEQQLYQMKIGEADKEEDRQSLSAEKSSKDMPIIRKGCKGSVVQKMQKALLNQNFKTCKIRGEKREMRADGDWGEITDSIFRRWQGYVGLKADGICGPKSWEKLGY